MYVNNYVDWAIPVGKCVNGVVGDGEITLQIPACDLPKYIKACEPVCETYPCIDIIEGDDACCDETNEILAELLEKVCLLELPEAAGVTQIGCVREDTKSDVTGIVLACKNADGSLRYVLKPVDGSPLIDPYDGPFSTECGEPVRYFLNCYLGDTNSPYCDSPLYKCGDEIQICDPVTGQWITLNPETTDLSNTFKPAAGPAEEWAKEDLTPYKIEGEAGPTTLAEIFAEALAASDVVDYAATPCDILEEHVSRCGAVSISEISGNGGVVINDLPAQAAFNDIDGVNMANTVTVPAGCCVIVSFCARKQFTPTKIPVVTRVDGENVTLSDPPDVADGDTVEFTDGDGNLVSTTTVASGAGTSSLVLATAQTAAVKGTFLKRSAGEGVK